MARELPPLPHPHDIKKSLFLLTLSLELISSDIWLSPYETIAKILVPSDYGDSDCNHQ